MTVRSLLERWLMLLLAASAMNAYAQSPTNVPKHDTHEEAFEYGQFGTVHAIVPDGPIKDVVLFATGDGGWNPGLADMAQLIANEGVLVIGFDTVRYLQALDKGEHSCIYPAGDFEYFAHVVEKRYKLPNYIVPVLIGYSSGASLTYAVLAQAPKGTFRGVINLGFCQELISQRPLCRGRGVKFEPRKDDLLLQPSSDLGTPWLILQGNADEACSLDAAKAFASSIGSARVIPLDKVGHGFAVGHHWHLPFVHAYRSLAPKPAPVLAAAVNDLPIIETDSVGKPAPYLAVLLTGDGGWAGLDQELAAHLARAGIPVAALNSLKYFWNEREPGVAARDLARLIEHYVIRWRRNRVLLIGYSFGADVLPEMAARLPQRVRERVVSLNLIGPEGKADFEIRVGGWFGRQSEGLPVRPALQTIAGYKLPVVCMHGAEEGNSFCSELPAGMARDVVMPGGHHFNGEYARLVDVILNRNPPPPRNSVN